MKQPLLKIENICKSYGDKMVVNQLKFELYEGDILGFIGPNGAGKSTSADMITSLVTPDSGSVYYRGKNIRSQEKEFKCSLGVVPQDLAIYEDLSAYDNVKFFCSLYGFKGDNLKNRTKTALELTGLLDRCRDKAGSYSGGMKRRLNIACAIAHTPKLLIMDEPTVGIDPQSRNNIMETVKLLNKNGTAVIYTSHYMEEIETLCNRIVLLDNGMILEDMDKQLYKEKYYKRGLDTLEAVFLHLTGTDLRDMEG